MSIGLIIALFVGLGAVVLYYTFQRMSRVHETIRRTAGELGLAYQGVPVSASWLVAAATPWRMEGAYQGVTVACYPVTRGSGNSRTTYTVVEARFPASLGLGLHVGKETALTRLGKLVFDLQDITVGAQRFDEAVRVKARDIDRARSLLARPQVQDAVIAALEESPSLVVTDTEARAERVGTLTDAGTYRATLDLLCGVVRCMAAAGA